MSVWATANSGEVFINISGDVYAEHLDALEQNLLKHVLYGYRRIVVNINGIKHLDEKGIQVFQQVRQKMMGHGGELIIEDDLGKLAL